MKITSDSQSLASGPDGRLKRQDIFKNTFYFVFNLLTSEAGVASQLESLASSQCRKLKLKAASIISFSSSADGSPEIRGSIAGRPMWQGTVRTWLTDTAIRNLQLHPIADRFNDPKILLFLADSTLPMGLRLHVDTMGRSDTPRVRAVGRPPKTTAGGLLSPPAAADPVAASGACLLRRRSALPGRRWRYGLGAGGRSSSLFAYNGGRRRRTPWRRDFSPQTPWRRDFSFRLDATVLS